MHLSKNVYLKAEYLNVMFWWFESHTVASFQSNGTAYLPLECFVSVHNLGRYVLCTWDIRVSYLLLFYPSSFSQNPFMIWVVESWSFWCTRCIEYISHLLVLLLRPNNFHPSGIHTAIGWPGLLFLTSSWMNTSRTLAPISKDISFEWMVANSIFSSKEPLILCRR